MQGLRIIAIIGLLFSFMFFLDLVLPKSSQMDVVVDELSGIERGSGTINTHVLLVTKKDLTFPVFIDDDPFFERGDTIEISKSLIFRRNTYVVNLSTNQESIPAVGIFSYYFAVPVLLLIFSVFGLKYKKSIEGLSNIVAVIIFLIAFLVYLLF